MRRAVIIGLTLWGLAGTALAAHAQSTVGRNAVVERMYISTDKDNYLAGEIVWMKLITTDPAGTPQVFSKVGYVELTGEKSSHARARIEIRGGTGEGTIVIPSTLPTGWYRLTGYTRWMRNEGPGVFFEKRIGIVNPALGEVPRGSAAEPDPGSDSGSGSAQAPRPADSSSPAGSMRVTADRNSYSPRGEVRLDVSGIPADIHTLAVSVTSADPLGGFTRSGLAEWRPAPAASTAQAAGATQPANWDAEWEGALVTGKLVSSETGQPVYSPSVLPLVSFPGGAVNLFGGSISPDGSVTFRTARATGHGEIATSMRGSGTEPWRIDVDDPFADPATLVRPLPTFPLDAIDRESVLRGSFAMQVQYSYLNDSLTFGYRPETIFTERPHDTYLMDEWRRFATMGEVIVEFVQLVQVRRSDRGDGKRVLSVITPWYGTAVNSNSLVLLDGVPIIDHEIIYNYNPLLIDRIDVYTGRYTFGQNVFFGIVALYTERNSYPELLTDPFTQILSYNAPQARRRFYAPDYSDPARTASRLPDFRHTLYWDADVQMDGDVDENGSTGESASITFHASDLTGTWQVLVEGITTSGEPVSAVCSLEVR